MNAKSQRNAIKSLLASKTYGSMNAPTKSTAHTFGKLSFSHPFSENFDQAFMQYSSLQKHMRVHDKMKPYKCHFPNCKLAFSQVNNLQRHMRRHTGEKPF